MSREDDWGRVSIGTVLIYGKQDPKNGGACVTICETALKLHPSQRILAINTTVQTAAPFEASHNHFVTLISFLFLFYTRIFKMRDNFCLPHNFWYVTQWGRNALRSRKNVCVVRHDEKDIQKSIYDLPQHVGTLFALYLLT